MIARILHSRGGRGSGEKSGLCQISQVWSEEVVYQ